MDIPRLDPESLFDTVTLASIEGEPNQVAPPLAENKDFWDDSVYSRRVRAEALADEALNSLPAPDLKKGQDLLLVAAECLARAKLPTATLRSETYMLMEDQRDSSSVMKFLIHAGTLAFMEKDYQGSMVWLVEALAILENMQYALQRSDPKYDWEPQSMAFLYSSATQDSRILSCITIQTYSSLMSVLRTLGNTAASESYRSLAQNVLANMPSAFFQHPSIVALGHSIQSETATYRHPEPSLVTSLNIVDKDMHIYGSWKKIHLRSAKQVAPRMESAVFAHQGYLYVCGGKKSSRGPIYSDFWRLDLEKRGKWEPLPMFPGPVNKLEITRAQFFVKGPCAYLFSGSQIIHYFDLSSRVWGTIPTMLKRNEGLKSWPYPYGLKGFSMQLVNDRVYVFGGQGPSGIGIMGCDLLMELDLSTWQWRRLSGTYPNTKPSLDIPGPRVSAASWVNRARTKIFIMNGHADRVALQTEPRFRELAGRNHLYNDLWSWDIAGEVWTKEKAHGNFPGPRSEMATVYNSTLDVVVTFGGYSPIVPCCLDERVVLQFSYFADTFICDMNETKLQKDIPASPSISIKWKQVLTRGFPTYRADAQLVEDTLTGKTYLFSGFFEREFLPEGLSSDAVVRSFSDIWELRMDVPGGNFEGVDVDEEARTAKAGPWQRCFSCGSVGSWKKCGGSCGGRAFFCDTDCLKDGWKEHKVRHECRKV